MKKTIILCCLFASFGVLADDKGDCDKNKDKFFEQLELTAEQRPQVEQLHQQFRQQMQDLRERTRAEKAKIKASHEAELGTVLTAEQMAKRADMLEQKRHKKAHKRMRKHRQEKMD